MGAFAISALAIGALAIGRMKIRLLIIDGAEIKSLEIHDLTAKRLHAAEVNVSDSLNLQVGDLRHKIPSRNRFLSFEFQPTGYPPV